MHRNGKSVHKSWKGRRATLPPLPRHHATTSSSSTGPYLTTGGWSALELDLWQPSPIHQLSRPTGLVTRTKGSSEEMWRKETINAVIESIICWSPDENWIGWMSFSDPISKMLTHSSALYWEFSNAEEWIGNSLKRRFHRSKLSSGYF